MVNALLRTPSFNGTYPLVGFNWWSWQDFQNLNQGLVSIHDNAYDGHEAITGTVPCLPPNHTLACGGEAANYGDAISQIKAANLLWLEVSSPIVTTKGGQDAIGGFTDPEARQSKQHPQQIDYKW